MSHHEFIFSPGQWIGEGRVTFSASPEHLRFYTKWSISKNEIGKVQCEQRVEMQGSEDPLTNKFVMSSITPESFSIQLTNDLLGSVNGKGLIDQKTIAWEFHGLDDFEGFEVYELQDNGDYMFHAEYLSTEQFRTVVDGRIWRKEI